MFSEQKYLWLHVFLALYLTCMQREGLMEKLRGMGAYSQFCYIERHMRSSRHCVFVVYPQYPRKNLMLNTVQKYLSIGSENCMSAP